MVDVQELVRHISEDSIEHYGVLGMKWGVRKDRNTGVKRGAPTKGTDAAKRKSTGGKKMGGEVVLRKPLKNGGELVVRKIRIEDRPALTRLLANLDESYRKELETINDFRLTDRAGNKVGSASFSMIDNKTILLEWIGVKKSERRQGYAKAALEGVIEYAQSQGVERLEMVATNMGAKLYPQLGFQTDGKSGRAGKYHMDIKKKVSHEDFDLEKLADFIVKRLDELMPTVEHLLENISEDTLEHYGVLGMKWGVRKDPNTGKKSGSPAKGSKRAERSSKSLSPSNEVKNRSNTDRSAAKQQRANEKHQAKQGKKEAKASDRAAKQKASQERQSQKVREGAAKEASKRQAIKDKAAGKGEKAEAKAQKKSDRNEMRNAAAAAESVKMQMQAASNQLEVQLMNKYIKEHGAKTLLPGSQARSQYLNEFSDKYTQLLNESVKQFGDYFPNYEVHFGGNMMNVREPVALLLDKRKAKHEDGPPEIHFEWDSNGAIKGVKNIEEVLKWIFEQGEDEDLKHWGVPGMKWGVRKDRNTGKRKGSPIAGTKAATRKGTKKRRQSARSEAKSMTNDQLRSANERMRLEQEFQKLRKQEKSGGNNTAKLIKDIGDTSAALASGVRTASEVIRLVNQLKK